MRFPDHTQRHITVGRAPLDEWSAHHRDFHLVTYNTHKRQTSIPTAGFEPTVSAGEWPQTYALDHTATGTGLTYFRVDIQRYIWSRFIPWLRVQFWLLYYDFIHCANKVRHCILSYGIWRYVTEYLVPGVLRWHNGLIFQLRNARRKTCLFFFLMHLVYKVYNSSDKNRAQDYNYVITFYTLLQWPLMCIHTFRSWMHP